MTMICHSPHNLVRTKRCLVLALSRKDFAEVLYYRRMQQQAAWQSFLLAIPFVAAMPYHLSQDMCGLLYEQVYMTDEVVYDVGDTNCDTLYFVWAGKLKVQAKVTITQDTVMPIGNKVWEKNTRSTDVHYFVKQLDAG